MSNSEKKAACSKYAYAIAQTGFKGGMIMDDYGQAIQINESCVIDAVNKVHAAWDAHRVLKKRRTPFKKVA